MSPRSDAKGVPLAAMRARRRIAAHFNTYSAHHAALAIEFVPQGLDELREFEALLRGGVIRQREPGYYWYDLDIDRLKERRRRLVPKLLAAALLVALAVRVYYRA